MIKVVVSNMSCGHCQLKINAELKAKNYKVLNIDMDNNTVLIDTSSNEVRNIRKILESINYVIDDDIPILDIEEKSIWDDKLNDDNNYEDFTNYLLENNIKIIGFDDDNFGVVILCTNEEYNEVLKYIEETH